MFWASSCIKNCGETINNILIDDGTEKIMVRFFEENKNLLDLEVGEVVFILGRVREYQKEKYILPGNR